VDDDDFTLQQVVDEVFQMCPLIVMRQPGIFFSNYKKLTVVPKLNWDHRRRRSEAIQGLSGRPGINYDDYIPPVCAQLFWVSSHPFVSSEEHSRSTEAGRERPNLIALSTPLRVITSRTKIDEVKALGLRSLVDFYYCNSTELFL
jgi:hypothetical protein